MQLEAANANLVACQKCGRTFNPDRIVVHERVCKAGRGGNVPPLSSGGTRAAQLNTTSLGGGAFTSKGLTSDNAMVSQSPAQIQLDIGGPAGHISVPSVQIDRTLEWFNRVPFKQTQEEQRQVSVLFFLFLKVLPVHLRVQNKFYTSNLQVDWCLDKTFRSRINALVNKYLDTSQKKLSVIIVMIKNCF